MQSAYHEVFLSLAIQKAWEYQTLALPNPSVGALILSEDHQILALVAHKKAGEAHAELEALKIAFQALKKDSDFLDSFSPQELYDFLCKNHNRIFEKCSIFVTLEPCNHYGKTPPCAKLLAHIKPKRVIFGASENNIVAKDGALFLRQQGIEVIGGVCENECLKLLYPFLTFQRQKRLNLFKIAQRLNGSYTNGQISNLATKAFTHSQRSVANALIISGKTILTDCPKLDVRYAYSGFTHQPKIKILSRQILNSSQLQCIQSKQITLHSCIDTLGLNQGFNVIEGGYKMLESLKEMIDLFMVIFAPVFGGESSKITQNIQGELLHTQSFKTQDQEDIVLWIKNQN